MAAGDPIPTNGAVTNYYIGTSPPVETLTALELDTEVWDKQAISVFQPLQQNIEGVQFRSLLAVEDQRVTDGRMLRAGSIFTRTPPIPLMFLDRNTGAHDQAQFVGNIMRVWRDGNEIWGEGVFDNTSRNPAAHEAVRLVSEGRLRGVSVDTATVEVEFKEEEDEDGFPIIVGLDIIKAELLGATIVPFPAFDNTFIHIPESRFDVVASGLPLELPGSLTASAAVIKEPDELTPWTVDGDTVYGHLAPWNECHQSFNDSCVMAPRSKSNYARFLIGKMDGQRVGVITLGTLHAPQGLTPTEVARHYADTGSVAAYVTITDGKHGPWVSGTIEPDLSDSDRRRLAACGISGDWRTDRQTGSLELISILAVPTPGFSVPRYEDPEALVASAVEHFECIACEEQEKARQDLFDASADVHDDDDVHDDGDDATTLPIEEEATLPIEEEVASLIDAILEAIESEKVDQLLEV